MTAQDDGGPAFPHVWEPVPGAGPGFRRIVTDGGMSLRDYFAAAALQGLLANPNADQHYGKNGDVGGVQKLAQNCYRAADALLAARKEQKQ